MERRKTFRGSLCCSHTRGHAAAPYRSGARGPAGVGGTGQTGMGAPQELGTPDRLRLENDRPWGWPDPNTPGPKPASGLCGATNRGARGGNRLAEATKWDGTDGRESERSIVPLKPGNSCHEDPAEGRGRLVAGPWPGNSAGALNLDQLST